MSNAPEGPRSVNNLKLAGFGRCIYCGSDGGARGLFSEHLIPFSLNGTAEILDASCKACEGKTSYIEGYLANEVFRDHRIHARLQSRSKTTTKTKELKATFAYRGKPETTAMLPVHSHPHFISLPWLRGPGLLEGREPEQTFWHRGAHSLALFPDGLSAAIGAPEGEQVHVKNEREINLRPFARAMAKIGYCHAVAMLGGPDKFNALDVPKLILGEYNYLPYYVGGYDADAPPRVPNRQHMVGVSPVNVGARKLLVANIRLFANIGAGDDGPGTPIYRVVVGEVI